MANLCANCQAENREEAKYCDNCGAVLDPSISPGPTTQSEQSRMNWGAIVIVLIIVAGLGWILFGPSGNGQNGGQPGPMTNPHSGMGGNAGGATGENPHAAPGTDEGMNQMLGQFESMKAQLDEDPLNLQVLVELYRNYGPVNMTDKLKPYLQNAVDAVKESHASMESDELYSKINGIVSATYLGGVANEGMEALDQIEEVIPDYNELKLIRANIMYDARRAGYPEEFLSQYPGAEELYTQYLDSTTPDEAGLLYWNAKTDRATEYIEEGLAEGDEAKIALAIEELYEVTDNTPLNWGAWFNLGIAQMETGDIDNAEISFSRSQDVADDENEKFMSATKLAELRGEEPPAPPGGTPNPHGSMGGGMGATPEGMANPHGGEDMGGTGGGMANPHGGMNMGGSGDPGDGESTDDGA